MKPVCFWQANAHVRPNLDSDGALIRSLSTRIRGLINVAAIRFCCNIVRETQFDECLDHFEKNMDQLLGPKFEYFSTDINSCLREAVFSLLEFNCEDVLQEVAYAETIYRESIKPSKQFLTTLKLVFNKQNNEFLPLFMPIKNWSVAWRTSDTVGLANTIYAEKRFDLCGILGDALKDAGCEDEDVIWVLSNPFICRGTWLLEQLR